MWSCLIDWNDKDSFIFSNSSKSSKICQEKRTEQLYGLQIGWWRTGLSLATLKSLARPSTVYG